MSRTHFTDTPAPSELLTMPTSPARAALAALRPGGRVMCVTKGQFSLLDVIAAALDMTGPADVDISSWTASLDHVQRLAHVRDTHAIRAMRLMFGHGFSHFKTDAAKEALRLFSAGAIRSAQTHMKFALVRNERWALVILTSANLNQNDRFEQFMIEDSAPLETFFRDHVDEIFGLTPEGLSRSAVNSCAAFTASMGGANAERGECAGWLDNMP